MEINAFKLDNQEHHDYFVQTTYKILKDIGLNYSIEEIEKMSIKDNYRLYIHNKKTKKWHIGIWAVGEWGVKESINGNVINCGYGIDVYKPLTISVFLVHDWTFDKFRPTYSDWEKRIEYNDDVDGLIKDLKYIVKNPINSYYNIVDEDSYNYQHKDKNKYLAYWKGWYRNDFLSSVKEKYQRISAGFFTKMLMLITFFDRRVAYREYKFHKDKYNPEFDVAIVFKYGKTEWHDWKRWHDYNRLFRSLQRKCGWNLDVDFTYLDEEGNLPKNIWRGVYWEEEP